MKNPFDLGYYETAELRDMGFAYVGENVKIAKTCTIPGNLSNIYLGNDIRVDGYTTIVGNIRLGNYIHIGAYCLLSGGDGIVLNDFCGLSNGVKLYSRSDDYSGNFLTNPTIPEKYLGIKRGKISLEKHVILGANAIILPSVTVGEGCSVGAQSLVKKDLDAWKIYAGCPVRHIGTRKKKLLELEAELLVAFP